MIPDFRREVAENCDLLKRTFSVSVMATKQESANATELFRYEHFPFYCRK